MNNAFPIKPVTWQNAQHQLAHLRALVFMQEQNISAEDEWDGKDETATHFLATNIHNQAIACARLLIEHEQEKTLFHVGRVAVLKTYRRQGIGNQLMQTVIRWCLEHNPVGVIYLHAQTDSIGFYQKSGFVTQGDIFMDAGIPHIEMWYKSNI